MIEHTLTVNIPLEAGGALEDAPLVYHTSHPAWDGEMPVVWICHALTANSDPEDWWPQMVGPGKPIDTQRNFVVCVNILGSAYGSAGPARINPATGKPWLLDFPRTTFRDVVQTCIIVRKHLGINRIDKLIGSSVGGYQAMEWAVTEPEVFEQCFLMATAPRISPYLAATLEAQRMALEADPTFRQARDIHGGEAGLRCARAQALISYRCFRGYGLTQAEPDPDQLFCGRAASYERYQGEKLVRRGFDAYSYKSLCDMMDSHNLGRGRGGIDKALARIQARTTVVSIDTDNIFPPEEARAWACFIPRVDYREIPSDLGHDGFLVETQRIAAIIA